MSIATLKRRAVSKLTLGTTWPSPCEVYRQVTIYNTKSDIISVNYTYSSSKRFYLVYSFKLAFGSMVSIILYMNVWGRKRSSRTNPSLLMIADSLWPLPFFLVFAKTVSFFWYWESSLAQSKQTSQVRWWRNSMLLLPFFWYVLLKMSMVRLDFLRYL